MVWSYGRASVSSSTSLNSVKKSRSRASEALNRSSGSRSSIFSRTHTAAEVTYTHTDTHTRKSLWWSREHHRVRMSSFMHHLSWTLKKWSASLSWALLLDFGCSFWPVGTESKDKKVRFYHCWNSLTSQINFLLIYLRIFTKAVRLQRIVCWHQFCIDID